MDARDSMPDFGGALGAGESIAFAPFAAGAFSVVPNELKLAVDRTGRPVFSLHMTKRTDDLSAAGQFAVLDVQLTGDYSLDAALAAARAQAPGATVVPAPIDVGYARLVAAGPDLPDDVTAAAELGWSSADGARWTRRLDIASGELIKGALAGGTLLFGGRAEFTVLGIAPRMATTVTFDPAQLLGLALSDNPASQIDCAALMAFLMRPLAALPLQIAGKPDTLRLPQILLDRLFAAYGALVPAPKPDDPPTIRFRNTPAGNVSWDLSQPVIVPRAFTLQFDLLTALRAVANPGSLVSETVIPALDLGFHTITITANLPRPRGGIAAIGVRIEVAPNPPFRPSGITQTLLLAAPDDSASVSVQLSPGEALSYRSTCFAIVYTGTDVFQCEAQPVSRDTEWLHLQPSDFPVLFVHLTATDRLLALANIESVLTFSYGGKTAREAFTLNKMMSDVTVAVPQGATDASLALTAVSLEGGKSLPVPNAVPGRMQIDLPSFSEYGPHRIAIAAAFGPGAGPISVDLTGEDGANPQTVALLPSVPNANWGYVAQSPFHAGYRYRVSGGNWSDAMPPAAPLSLTVN